MGFNLQLLRTASTSQLATSVAPFPARIYPQLALSFSEFGGHCRPLVGRLSALHTKRKALWTPPLAGWHQKTAPAISLNSEKTGSEPHPMNTFVFSSTWTLPWVAARSLSGGRVMFQ